MSYLTKEIKQGIKLHLIDTGKFKTNLLTVVLTLPLTKENVTLDTVVPAVPLGLDTNGQWIVTKSGNLGNQKALVDILKYFEQYNNE